MSTVHVYPDRDLLEHDTERGEGCICGPDVEAVFREDGSNGWLITHHSLDGREAREKACARPAPTPSWSAPTGEGLREKPCERGDPAMTVTIRDGLNAHDDLVWVADRWPDLKARLRPGRSGGGNGVRTQPTSRPPIDTEVSDLMWQIEEHARFLGKVLLEETNDWEPTTSAMPQLLREVAERYGHFIVGDDKTALDFCDEAHEFRRKVTHSLEKPPAPTYMGDCPAPLCEGDLYLKAGRTAMACPICGHETDVVAQREFIAGKLQERLMSPSELTSALKMLQFEVPYSTIRRWVSGEAPRLPEATDGLYRLSDAIQLADRRTRQRAVLTSNPQ